MISIVRTILLSLVLTIVLFSNSFATQKKFLFDANKAQTAGNADWVIDEDSHTPGRFPTPDQSGINSGTAETYWTGALSSWGVALVKLGNYVETLPNTGQITYNNISNSQDLSHYDVFIMDEPNIPFTSTEKTAIIQFVQNGGGLMLISDHSGADRNSDGWDAIRVLNDLIRNNGVQSYPFGFIFDSLNVNDITNNVLNPALGNPIISGSQGNVVSFQINNGTTLTINNAQNPNAKGLVWKTGVSQNNLNCYCVSSTFGTGRVVAVGDSSPQDDGTGSSGHTLYPGWTENGANSSRFHLNASLWLAKLSDVHVTSQIKIIIQGFYDTTSSKLNQRDTVRAYLRSNSSPFGIVDSAKSVIDSVTFTGNFDFLNAPSGTYYIEIKHRNSIETWSKSGGEIYTVGSAFVYDFTLSLTQAFGNNLIFKGSRYCIYSGDINKDGTIDLSDISSIYNDANIFESGYVATDVNGDRFVDLSDLTIAYNNANNFISKIIP